jgi:hypothetical protein
MNKEITILGTILTLFLTLIYFVGFHSYYKAGDCLVEFYIKERNEFNAKVRITTIQIEKVGTYSYLTKNILLKDSYTKGAIAWKRVENKIEIAPFYNVRYISKVIYRRAEKSVCKDIFKDKKVVNID